MQKDKFKISVVIPHYNAGNYIRKALDSLVNQTMNQEDFEVIIVDDKSTQPLDIIRHYEAKIKNLKILVEDKNHGYPSIPRNHGIDVAEGTFVLMIDQDDNLAIDTLQKFFSFAGEDSDIVIGKYAEGNGYNGTQVPFEKGNIKNVNVTKDHIVSTLAPHKMYRKSMLNKYKIRFFDSKYIPVAEDQVFNMKAYSVTRKISILADKDYYYWNQRDDFGNLGKSKAYVYDEPWKYLNVISEIFKSIETSPVWNKQEKMRLKAIYIGRIFNSQGTVIKTIGIQNSDLLKETLVNGLRNIINESMDDKSIWDVRQPCQWMVLGIKYGMSYSELLDFKGELYSTNFLNDIEIYGGKTIRNMIIKGNLCAIPVDFLNHESTRLINLDSLNKEEVTIIVSLQNDLNISLPTNIRLVMENRTTKEQFAINYSKVLNNCIVFSLKFRSFINSKVFQNGVFDVFVQVQRDSKISKYRLGNNKSILLSEPHLWLVDGHNIELYYTKGYGNLSMVIS
ncbi:glycosyltransferase family 2 protein [Leuconostoc pseudomesenteroides]|uniref:glycosyltransferase family 2 protein n=1 Tax=Leuconostoc pseudomesenteroides TaxID=33968 RepID=UPI0039EC6038